MNMAKKSKIKALKKDVKKRSEQAEESQEGAEKSRLRHACPGPLCLGTTNPEQKRGKSMLSMS
jgi:hypothetical protein